MLRAFFHPASIAVIGATPRPASVGRAVFQNLLASGSRAVVYPVHPRERSVLGVRAYPCVEEIPDPVELAVIIVPAEAVLGVVQECGRRKVPAAVILTAGFKEIGPEGAARQEAVARVAREAGVRLIGPNCLGIINASPDAAMNATFARGMPPPGRVAFLSQSGAMGVAGLEIMREEGFGLSKFAALGNKADLDECDLLEYLANDPETGVILLYVEDLERPKRFLEISRSITRDKGKPIVAIKSGRTAEGARAASSHTGALAGSDEAYDTLFLQSGVLRVERLDELFEYAWAFANQPVPRGKRAAIVTNAGGPGILATDAAVRNGLELARFEESTARRLAEALPRTAALQNPVDVIGDADADRFARALRIVLEDPNVDGAILICTPQLMTDLERTAQGVAEAARKCDKPLLASFLALRDAGEMPAILRRAKVPNYATPESAVRALAAMGRFAEWIHRPPSEVRVFDDVDRAAARAALEAARRAGRAFMTEPETFEVFRAYRLPLPPFAFAAGRDQAVAAAERIGYPVVLKIVSPDIVHKFDVGGVRVNLRSADEVAAAFDGIARKAREAAPESRFEGIFVQAFVAGGIETIVGARRDPHFGPILMFGLGGTAVEIFRDVTFRIAPIREGSAHRMIRQIRGFPLLDGFRGQPKADLASVAEVLMRLSQMVTEHEEIEELDVNPLKVLPEGRGAMALDGRIFLSENAAIASAAPRR